MFRARPSDQRAAAMKRSASAFDQVLAALEARGCKRTGATDWQCPAHDDQHASLSVVEVRSETSSSNAMPVAPQKPSSMHSV